MDVDTILTEVEDGWGGDEVDQEQPAGVEPNRDDRASPLTPTHTATADPVTPSHIGALHQPSTPKPMATPAHPPAASGYPLDTHSEDSSVGSNPRMQDMSGMGAPSTLPAIAIASAVSPTHPGDQGAESARPSQESARAMAATTHPTHPAKESLAYQGPPSQRTPRSATAAVAAAGASALLAYGAGVFEGVQQLLEGRTSDGPAAADQAHSHSGVSPSSAASHEAAYAIPTGSHGGIQAASSPTLASSAVDGKSLLEAPAADADPEEQSGTTALDLSTASIADGDFFSSFPHSAEGVPEAGMPSASGPEHDFFSSIPHSSVSASEAGMPSAIGDDDFLGSKPHGAESLLEGGVIPAPGDTLEAIVAGAPSSLEDTSAASFFDDNIIETTAIAEASSSYEHVRGSSPSHFAEDKDPAADGPTTSEGQPSQAPEVSGAAADEGTVMADGLFGQGDDLKHQRGPFDEDADEDGWGTWEIDESMRVE